MRAWVRGRAVLEGVGGESGRKVPEPYEVKLNVGIGDLSGHIGPGVPAGVEGVLTDPPKMVANPSRRCKVFRVCARGLRITLRVVGELSGVERVIVRSRGLTEAQTALMAEGHDQRQHGELQ